MVLQVRPETEAAIRERVERGEYDDADSVVQAALRVPALQEIRALVAESEAQCERGEFVELAPEV